MGSFSLDDLTLYVPSLWDQPWEEYVESSDGLERDFIIAQAAYAKTLRQIAGERASPEKMAWLSLWSRLFGALSGARGAAKWESRFAVTVMERVAMEAFLHLEVVMLPVLGGNGQPTSHAWKNVRDRLCGYLAWTLYGDELFYRQLLDDKILEAIFDPVPERKVIEELGSSMQAWETLTGSQFEVVSDQEAFSDRKKARKQLMADTNRVTKWLSDPRLRPWIDKLRILKRDSTNHQGATTLFALFDLSSSVAGYLKKSDARIKYLTYLKGSGCIHGSSFEASMVATDAMIAPDYANFGRGFETSTKVILSDCRLAILLLQVLAGHLAPSEAGA
jgi:hypothetical protein